MIDRPSQSVNRMPPGLHFIVDALLNTAPRPAPVRAENAGQRRPGSVLAVGKYKAELSLDHAQCSLLKTFFDGTIGHIFSCGSAGTGEYLMCFTHQPVIRRDPASGAGTGKTQRRYICDIAMERVR